MRARRRAPGRFLHARARPEALPAAPGAAIWRGCRIGLLGGSFNPAHEGHLYISVQALKRLGLDHVWWLVSPQNPLKSKRGMAPFAHRLASARAAARHPRVHASALEHRLDTRYTADTLERLCAAVPGAHFVWLMGADNLAQFTKWQRWPDILATVPLAVIDRPHYSLHGLTGKLAARYRHDRLPKGALKALATKPTPSWTFVTLRRHPASATVIREARAKAAAGADPFALKEE